MRNQTPYPGNSRNAAVPAAMIATAFHAARFHASAFLATAFLATALLATTLLTGCAGNGFGGKGTDNNAASDKESILAITALKTGNFSADGRYHLSREERAQSCKRIKGKMNVRIVQLKRTGILRNSSTLARKFSGFFAGKSDGLNSRTGRRRERAILVAYNQLLAEKKCPTIDLDKEMNRSPPTTTKARPKSTIPPQTR